MGKKNEFIEINLVKFPHLAKCQICNRVKDIYYKTVIYSVEPEASHHKYMVGDLTLCKQCGDNLSKALNNEVPPDEAVIKEFTF